MPKLFFAFFTLIILASCANEKDWQKIELKNLRGDKVNFEEKTGPMVFYFLSPQCPLCENYALNIKEHYEDFELEEISFYGIFPGKYYSKEEILKYKKTYDLGIEFLMDPKYAFTHALDATVTPEVFVFDAQKKLIYEGAIDNWMVHLGKKRTVITEHYLKDALHAVLNKSSLETTKTLPVGCYIE